MVGIGQGAPRAAFQRALARHGRRDAVRVRRLYAAAAEPVGRSAVVGRRARNSRWVGSFYMYVIRATIVAGLLLGIFPIATACLLNPEEVDFTFDNRSDSSLCFFRYEEDAAAGGCPQEVKPLAQTSWRPGCGKGRDADELPLNVILTVAEGAQRVYDRTEKCRFWQDSNRTFIIEQRGDEFVVTDSLPE